MGLTGHEHEGKENGKISLAVYAALGLLVLVLAFNQYQISSLSTQMSLFAAPVATGASSVVANSGTQAGSSVSQANLQAIADRVIPKGTPNVYGSELAVSYDKPVESLTILGKLDGDLYPDGKLKYSDLDSAAQKRYVTLGTEIACEYCCGATELVQADGKPACGCQHSAAMRGLAKYLLLKHPDMSDQQILEEMSKWKILFFPKPHLDKALSFASAGLDSSINAIDLASNKFRGFKAPAQGSQQTSQSSGNSVGNAPNQVGGC